MSWDVKNGLLSFLMLGFIYLYIQIIILLRTSLSSSRACRGLVSRGLWLLFKCSHRTFEFPTVLNLSGVGVSYCQPLYQLVFVVSPTMVLAFYELMTLGTQTPLRVKGYVVKAAD